MVHLPKNIETMIPIQTWHNLQDKVRYIFLHQVASLQDHTDSPPQCQKDHPQCLACTWKKELHINCICHGFCTITINHRILKLFNSLSACNNQVIEVTELGINLWIFKQSWRDKNNPCFYRWLPYDKMHRIYTFLVNYFLRVSG